MLKISFGLNCLILLILTLVFIEAPPSTHYVVKESNPGVVFISRLDINPETGLVGTDIGTGFFTGENLITTAAHVVGGDITKFFPTDETVNIIAYKGAKSYVADVVAKDVISDVAWLRIEDWEGFKRHNKYNILEYKNSRGYESGQEAIAIGHPSGAIWSISKGIISNPERNIVQTMPSYFLQADIDIGPGNSGGPLLDNNGYVIGINDAIVPIMGGHLSYIIPSNIIQKVYNDLFNSKTEVQWTTVGLLSMRDDDENLVVKTLKHPDTGLKIGDILQEYRTKLMTGWETLQTPYDLRNAIAELSVGDKIDLWVLRDGLHTTVSIDLKNYNTSSSYFDAYNEMQSKMGH